MLVDLIFSSVHLIIFLSILFPNFLVWLDVCIVFLSLYKKRLSGNNLEPTNNNVSVWYFFSLKNSNSLSLPPLAYVCRVLEFSGHIKLQICLSFFSVQLNQLGCKSVEESAFVICIHVCLNFWCWVGWGREEKNLNVIKLLNKKTVGFWVCSYCD